MRWPAVALTIALLGISAAAEADNGEASDHHRAAVAYAKSGRWDDAVRELDEAYKLEPTPLRLYDVAQACLQAKQYKKARDAYASVENSGSLSPEQRDRARAGRATASANVGRVHVTVEGARPADVVTVDGSPVTGDEREVDPGRHVVRLGRGGRVVAETTVDVAPGGDASTTLAAAAPAPATVEAPAEGDGTRKVVAWTLIGVGVPAMAVGASLALIGKNQYDKARAEGCPPECGGADANGRSLAIAGDITLVAGAVVTLAAVYLFLTMPSEKKTSLAPLRLAF